MAWGPGRRRGCSREHPPSRSLARPDSWWKCSWMQTGWGALGAASLWSTISMPLDTCLARRKGVLGAKSGQEEVGTDSTGAGGDPPTPPWVTEQHPGPVLRGHLMKDAWVSRGWDHCSVHGASPSPQTFPSSSSHHLGGWTRPWPRVLTSPLCPQQACATPVHPPLAPLSASSPLEPPGCWAEPSPGCLLNFSRSSCSLAESGDPPATLKYFSPHQWLLSPVLTALPTPPTQHEG